MTEAVDCATSLLEALIPKIETLGWDGTRARFPTVDLVAKVMVASVPTVLITTPAIPTAMFATSQVTDVTVRSKSPALAQLIIAFREDFPSDQSNTGIPPAIVSPASARYGESGAPRR